MALSPPDDLVTIAKIQDRERHTRIRSAYEAYMGEAPAALKARRNETTNDNVRVNMAREIVDGGVAKLFGK